MDENYNPQWSPQKIVRSLARRKAEDVVSQFGNALIIAADTIVAFQGQILEKPNTPTHAKSMLQQLSGNTHQVLTAVTLIKTDASHNITNQNTFVEKTHVMFGNLNLNLIEEYVATDNPMDKAGGYGIQDPHGALFVKSIKGDFYNVVGFPLHSFYNTMTSFAPDFLSPIEPDNVSNSNE